MVTNNWISTQLKNKLGSCIKATDLEKLKNQFDVSDLGNGFEAQELVYNGIDCIIWTDDRYGTFFEEYLVDEDGDIVMADGYAPLPLLISFPEVWEQKGYQLHFKYNYGSYDTDLAWDQISRDSEWEWEEADHDCKYYITDISGNVVWEQEIEKRQIYAFTN